MEALPHRFFEETVLTVLAWVGLWGIVSLLLDHYVRSWTYKLAAYTVLVIASFSLLHVREHITPTTRGKTA